VETRLADELKTLIFEACDLVDVSKEELKIDDYLLGPESPLGLDSVDALEIVIAVQNRYGVRIDNKELAREVLVSLRTLTEFLERKGVGP
jgi:acyl carrier protein